MSRIPYGCDQQGRFPQAAECCTEIGCNDDCIDNIMSKQFVTAVLAVAGAFLVTVVLAWWIR